MVMAAYGLPKAAEAEKAQRQEAIQAALQEATRVPLSTLQQAVDLLPATLRVVEKGNPNARSDAASSYFLLQAAADGAVLNVKINLASIKDEEFKRDITAALRQAEGARRDLERRARELLAKYFPDA